MGLPEILALIQGVLQFPGAVLALVKALKSTPVEQQAKLISSIQAELSNFQKTGRPTWE